MDRNTLKEKVVLFNYTGEVNDVATYQETILVGCYVKFTDSTAKNTKGRRETDTARLYIFDNTTSAFGMIKTKHGQTSVQRRYLPYDQWVALEEKYRAKFWTINDKGVDYFKIDGKGKEMCITAFSIKQAGSKQMWHMEVDAK